MPVAAPFTFFGVRVPALTPHRSLGTGNLDHLENQGSKGEHRHCDEKCTVQVYGNHLLFRSGFGRGHTATRYIGDGAHAAHPVSQ